MLVHAVELLIFYSENLILICNENKILRSNLSIYNKALLKTWRTLEQCVAPEKTNRGLKTPDPINSSLNLNGRECLYDSDS